MHKVYTHSVSKSSCELYVVPQYSYILQIVLCSVDLEKGMPIVILDTARRNTIGDELSVSKSTCTINLTP